jgi:hypothetical protein
MTQFSNAPTRLSKPVSDFKGKVRHKRSFPHKILQFEQFRRANESLGGNNEPLVGNNEPLVGNNEPLVGNNEPFGGNNEPLVGRC